MRAVYNCADTVVTDTMRYVDLLAANATTSLQRDIAEGKPSEIDYWNGSVVRQGRMAKVSTPVNQFIYDSLLPQELRARGKICHFRNEPREICCAHTRSDLRNGLSGIEMMFSAELRWFWRGRCPHPVYDWFFKSGLPPGGGPSRVDRYIPQRRQPDISLKRRGNKPDLEIKGLVATRRARSSNRSHPISKFGASGPAQFEGSSWQTR